MLNVFSFDVSIKESSYYPNKKIKQYIMKTSIEEIDEVKIFLIDNALRKELKVEKNFLGNYFFEIRLKDLVGDVDLIVNIKYDNKEFSKFYPNFLDPDNYKTETDIKIIPLKSETGLDFLIDVSYSKNID
jgi:hypothetical protein